MRRIDDTQQFPGQPTRELPRVTAIKQTRRIVILVIGTTLIATSLALIVVPGPFSIPLFLLGLTVLSWEFAWAKRLLFGMKQKVRTYRKRRRRRRIR
jgi:phosphotransferase system  glucose/maltose/N-acetylglucosamine-specific IIC component